MFNCVQKLIGDNLIKSGHDVSDGGLITTLLEMAFSGNCGMDIIIPDNTKTEKSPINVLFAEEPALVLEVAQDDLNAVEKVFSEFSVSPVKIGYSVLDKKVCISVGKDRVLDGDMPFYRDIWEETSFQLEKLQCNPLCVAQEQQNLKTRKSPPFKLNFSPKPPMVSCLTFGDDQGSKKPKVAVIREEGSNGDREMASSFYLAGFQVWDVTMHDICTGSISLDIFRGVVFVGGFSYADVFGSAKGWASVAKFNPVAREELERFRKRPDTFSLGVCNGCQLMALMGWVGQDTTSPASGPPSQGVVLTQNVSERFESRFVTVSIEESPALMLRGMEGSTLGIWVAHGEGKPQFRDEVVLDNIRQKQLAPIRYVDDNGAVTTSYPFNPNGAVNGIAAMCSEDGRHLAMMPHPERCTLLWQWPWLPQDWNSLPASPWLQMFHNAYEWCTKN